VSGLPARPPRRRSSVSAPFWEAARERRLRLQRCDACGYVRWPPAADCPECLAEGGTWTDLAPHGTVWSYCVYEHCYDEAFRDAPPYVVALVELDEGPVMMTNLVGADVGVDPIGTRVAVRFTEFAGGLVLPLFAPERAA